MKAKVVIIGCGIRGQGYAKYALDNPSEMEIVAELQVYSRLSELKNRRVM